MLCEEENPEAGEQAECLAHPPSQALPTGQGCHTATGGPHKDSAGVHPYTCIGGKQARRGSKTGLPGRGLWAGSGHGRGRQWVERGCSAGHHRGPLWVSAGQRECAHRADRQPQRGCRDHIHWEQRALQVPPGYEGAVPPTLALGEALQGATKCW